MNIALIQIVLYCQIAFHILLFIFFKKLKPATFILNKVRQKYLTYCIFSLTNDSFQYILTHIKARQDTTFYMESTFLDFSVDWQYLSHIL